MKFSKKLWAIIAILSLALLIGLGFFIKTLFTKEAYKASFRKINSPVQSTYKAFGNKILYYDGSAIYCLNDNGATRWSYDVGENAAFHTDGVNVVIWRGSNLYVLDENGNSKYSDNLGQDILFARIGKQFFGVALGNERKSRIIISDLSGTQIDEMSDSFQNALVLDFNFFGNFGEFLWTLKLDTDSTAPNSVLNTFEVGKMNTGELSLGNYITYAVNYDNESLSIINTRRMLYYDYRLSKETKPPILVYGWELLDKALYEGANGFMLFKQTTANADTGLNELRLISGNTDKRYTLPTTAVCAFISNKNLYAISSNTIYKVSLNDVTFESYPLDINGGVTGYITKLNNNKVLISDGSDVYVLKLP